MKYIYIKKIIYVGYNKILRPVLIINLIIYNNPDTLIVPLRTPVKSH